MKKSICAFISLLSLVVYAPAYAHQDKIIAIESGRLIGLPDKYQPAFLDMEGRSMQIGANTIDFPPCIGKYFPKSKPYDLFVTSSWYHDLSVLPPYITIEIKPKGEDYSFQLIFEMDDLSPYQFNVFIYEANGIRNIHQLVITQECQDSIENSYTKKKL